MSGDARWRIFTDIGAAKQSILKRHSLRDTDVPEALIKRSASIFGERIMPEEAVRRIIASVRERGDQAINEWNRKIDNISLDRLDVSSDEMNDALRAISPELRSALEHAAERIRTFHEKQPISSWIDAGQEGSLGQLIRPVDSVGVYVPGGTAPLPSSLLMSVIPAQVAGVPQIVVCTPPGSGAGDIHPAILAAAANRRCGYDVPHRWRSSDRRNGLWQRDCPARRDDSRRGQYLCHARQTASLWRCGH